MRAEGAGDVETVALYAAIGATIVAIAAPAAIASLIAATIAVIAAAIALILQHVRLRKETDTDD